MYARVPQATAQFVLKIEKFSHIMGPTPILEMVRAYGLHPRLWLLSELNDNLFFVYITGEVEEEVETADESALTSRGIYLVDSGLVLNSPYPPLLRPERGVDVFLSFGFSVRKRDVEFPFEVKTYFKTRSTH